jgi:hypothetical protein
VARKPNKPKADSAHPRNAVVVVQRPEENPDDACARALTRPEVQAAAAIQQWQGDNQEVNALARELAAQVAAVNSGDLKRAEGMLIAQAHTLDEIFNHLARRAHGNIGGGYLDAADRYMRLALKAQSQCRATLESLATIKNPPVLFAKQANIAAGPQQVNNGIPAPSRAREFEKGQSKLLEGQDGERLDTRTASAAVDADPQLAALGEIHGAEDTRGKGSGEPERL